MKKQKVPYWLLNNTIAHRGLHDSSVIENTLGAFQRAVEKNYAIELDVHITLDGRLAVFHDDTLQRLAGINKKVEECTMDELKSYGLKGTSEKIPELNEVFDLVKGKVPILIEVKSGGKPGELESRLYRALRRYIYDYAVQSFNPFSVKWFKDNAPEIIRGQLSGDFKGENPIRRFVLKYCLFSIITKPHFIGYDISLMPNIVTKVSKFLSIPVLGWTARTKEDREAIRYCDNIVMEGDAIRLGPLQGK